MGNSSTAILLLLAASACTPVIPPGYIISFEADARRMCSALPETYESRCTRCMTGERPACVQAVRDADSGLFGPEQLLGRERIYMLARGCLLRDSLACVLLSLSVKEGKGTAVDVERGDEMLDIACPGARRRCANGAPEACTGWGLCAGHLEFAPDSGALFARACGEGDAFGCVRLAERSSGGTLEYALARACSLDDQPACYELAQRRQFGLGLRRDEAWSTEFYARECSGDPEGIACWALNGYIPNVAVVKGFVTNPDALLPLTLNDVLPSRRSVVVGHCFNESGAVDHVEILRGSGSASADAAVTQAASQWRARPWLARLPVAPRGRIRTEPVDGEATLARMSVEFMLSGVFTDEANDWLHTMVEREVRRLGAVYVSRSPGSIDRSTRSGALKIAVRRVDDSAYIIHSFGPHAYPATLKVAATHRRAGLDAVLSAFSLVVATAVDAWEAPRRRPPEVPVFQVRCTASNLSFSTWRRAGSGPDRPPEEDEEIGPEDPGTRQQEVFDNEVPAPE